MSDYTKLPSKAKAQPEPFTAKIPEERLQEFKQLLKLSKIGPAVFENQSQDRAYGLNRDWLINAKKVWESDFDW